MKNKVRELSCTERKTSWNQGLLSHIGKHEACVEYYSVRSMVMAGSGPVIRKPISANPRLNHWEHAILLSRERVNKGTKRINCLPLSHVVISYTTLQQTKVNYSFFSLFALSLRSKIVCSLWLNSPNPRNKCILRWGKKANSGYLTRVTTFPDWSLLLSVPKFSRELGLVSNFNQSIN